MHEISVERFSRSSLESYKFIEVERKTILEIYRFWNRYFENRGIIDRTRIEDVINYERSLDS